MRLLIAGLVAGLSVCLAPVSVAANRVLHVATDGELREAVRQAGSGLTISVAPGVYSRGIFLKGIRGSAAAPFSIVAADPAAPPLFTGKGEALKLSNCSYVRISGLVIQGGAGNGINIDDGGTVEAPSHHILLENITVRDVGPRGNNDALKMSGVEHFVVRGCRFEGWGGSAIDMVGCHHGAVEDCRFSGKEGYRTANGIQIKGGSRSILVQRSFFDNAGERAINVGGMTGLRYFRPAGATYEAKDVIVAGNTFVGSEAPIAWVTSRDSHVHHNLFYTPEKWIGRILQETKDPRFTPSQKGLFEHNVVVTDGRVKTFFNVGRGTDSGSFVFRRNAWFRPGSSGKPRLPTAEEEGMYDFDPMLIPSPAGGFVSNSADPRRRKVGPWAYTPWLREADFGDVVLPSVVVPERSGLSWRRFF